MVDAAQNFVCIRLATYEDAEEAEFLKSIFVGRSGELENTVFCLLSPDGRKQLSRAGRGPHFAFRSPRTMANEMNEISSRYPSHESDSSSPVLPQMKNFRLSLNVAECDSRPLVACIAPNQECLQTLKDQLGHLAFSNELTGRFQFASTIDVSELKSIVGEKTDHGFMIIQTGEFGNEGHVAEIIPHGTTSDELKGRLVDFASGFRKRQKDHRDHVRKGKSTGINWESEIPVTDPMSNMAKDRDREGMRHGPEGKKGKRGKRKPPRRKKRRDR